MLVLRRLVVVGVGLIGGSVALALKRKQLVEEVVGVGRSQANLDDALHAGVVDRAFTLDDAWTETLHDASVVLVAAPVAQCPRLFAAMRLALGVTTIVTDAGSTKQEVIAAARQHFGDALPRFVPAHPIAGTEHSGALAASATLYDRRKVIVTPLAETNPNALATVRAFWEACGARVLDLDPQTHDEIFAAVSHLPHLLAAAYVAELGTRNEADTLFAHAGTGFQDFTRIAGASPEMWRDIALSNRAALAGELAAYRGALDVVAIALESGDGESLRSLFQAASDARRAWSDAPDAT